MAYVCLKDQLSGEVDSSGVWKWQGPVPITIDIQGEGVTALSPGQTMPGGDNPCIDPDSITGLTAATYSNAFQYCGSGCTGTDCAYVDLVLQNAPCAGAAATKTHCGTDTTTYYMNAQLNNDTCGKGTAGNWLHISGDNNAHLSNDNNAANDYYKPSEFPAGDHVYRKVDGNNCGEDTADLTISITEPFNAGPGGFWVNACDFITSKKFKLRDFLNLTLNAYGYPEVDPDGRWEIWGFSESGCGGVST